MHGHPVSLSPNAQIVHLSVAVSVELVSDKQAQQLDIGKRLIKRSARQSILIGN
jgi:hypothetical protein